MIKLLSYFRTVLRLGIRNSVTVILYRFALLTGYLKKVTPVGQSYEGPFFDIIKIKKNTISNPISSTVDIEDADDLLKGSVKYFSSINHYLGSPPNWHKNPFNGSTCQNKKLHWSNLSDFKHGMGDIKTIWEASRFDWAITLAKAYRLTGEMLYIDTLNRWANDWIDKNPLNQGLNWKCGQETGLRMLQVLLTAFLIKQHRFPSPSLIRFVMEHCSRIAPTIRYAIAQDNNHGTSEAAALFVGGAWLAHVSEDPLFIKKALGWKNIGRFWLENRVVKLVMDDGSFSQYSLNYHRVLVDTLNMVEFWRRQLAVKKFSNRFYQKCRSAVDWLYQMLDPESGDGPNLGANDGARLFSLVNVNYRDYRPSVQLGSVLFHNEKRYPPGPYDESLAWLEIDQIKPAEPTVPTYKSKVFPQGGYVVLRAEKPFQRNVWGVLRFPNFKFRPGHADALHFDFWYDGINLLRDSGSFSYNTDEKWMRYFPGTESHNTIQFDGRDQMPRLSRFLYGNWLKMNDVGSLENKKAGLSWSGEYYDYKGARHRRTITAEKERWVVKDEISGFSTSAVLRWRLGPGGWKMSDGECIGELARLKIESDKPMHRIELTEGWESRYYMERSKLPVLEVEVGVGKTVLTTEIKLKPIMA